MSNSDDKRQLQPCLPLPAVCNGFLVQKACCVPVSCPPIICDERIHLRLAGLTGNLNFQLFRMKGCPVEIEVECRQGGDGAGKETVKGIICNAGTDFVDIKQANNTVVTLMVEKIRLIKWTDPCCNPCVLPSDPCSPCLPC